MLVPGRSRFLSLPLILVLGAGSAAASCGSSVPCQPTGELGSCCENGADCPALTCLSQFPSGLCSMDCAATHQCPSGSHCVKIVSQSQGDLGTICLKQCGTGLPACRGDYGCRSAGDSGLQVCFPG
jgi:hypothetical protein